MSAAELPSTSRKAKRFGDQKRSPGRLHSPATSDNRCHRMPVVFTASSRRTQSTECARKGRFLARKIGKFHSILTDTAAIFGTTHRLRRAGVPWSNSLRSYNEPLTCTANRRVFCNRGRLKQTMFLKISRRERSAVRVRRRVPCTVAFWCRPQLSWYKGNPYVTVMFHLLHFRQWQKSVFSLFGEGCAPLVFFRASRVYIHSCFPAVNYLYSRWT